MTERDLQIQELTKENECLRKKLAETQKACELYEKKLAQYARYEEAEQSGRIVELPRNWRDLSDL